MRSNRTNHYTRRSSGMVLLLPGYSFPTCVYDTLAQSCGGAHVYEWTRNAEMYNVGAVVRDILRTRPDTIIAHSWGCQVALHVVASSLYTPRSLVLLEYHPFDNPAPDVYSDPDAVVQGFFPPRAPRDAPTERAVRHAFYPGTQSVHVGQSLVFSRDIVDAVTAQPRLRVLLSYGTTACTTPDGRIEHASMSKDQQPPLTRLASGMKTRATMHVVPHGSHFWFADPRYSQAVADIGKWVTTRTE